MGEFMSLDLEKSALRKTARIVRAAVHAEEGDVAARAIATLGLEAVLQLACAQRAGDGSPAVQPSDAGPATGGPLIVSGYAALPGELDPAILMAHLHEAGFELALPVTIGRARPLLFRAWVPGDAMGRGYMAIAEPLPSAAQVYPDIVLLPLLAFDDQGNRLGYGGGHYDRTLAGLRARKPIVTVGLAYDEQRVDVVPFERYDQRLNWILTPGGARRFGDE